MRARAAWAALCLLVSFTANVEARSLFIRDVLVTESRVVGFSKNVLVLNPAVNPEADLPCSDLIDLMRCKASLRVIGLVCSKPNNSGAAVPDRALTVFGARLVIAPTLIEWFRIACPHRVSPHISSRGLTGILDSEDASDVRRSGSVCLNSLGRFAKWIFASVMPPPSSVSAR